MLHRKSWLVILGVFLIAANLRLPITMMPPLLPRLAASGVLPHALAGLVTTIPLAMFALASPAIGRLGARLGAGRVLLGAAVALVVGTGLRLVPNAFSLLVGTGLVGLGITGGNVLLPALIKAEFPLKIAAMTTLYTTTMSLVATVGTGTSGPLAEGFGTTEAMAILGAISVLALVVWSAAQRRLHGVAAADAKPAAHAPRLAGQGLAWGIALFFGLQSILYYTLLTWLPSVWHEAGFSTLASGNLATIFQLCGMPMNLIIPSLAERRHGLMQTVAIASGGFVIGVVGIVVAPQLFAVQAAFAVIAGVASGAAFSVCIVFFQKKALTAAGTASLSGLAQSGGYLLAALGPVSAGLLAAGIGWHGVLWVAVALSAVLGLCGWVIVRRPAIQL